MIGLEDRQALAQDIETAHADGARLKPACEIAGIDVRTLQRWKTRSGLTAGDGCRRRLNLDDLGVRRNSWTGLCGDPQALAIFNWTESAKRDLDPLLVVPANV